MTPENFIYWLQGVLEIADPEQLDKKQIQIIKDHIKLVLKKETPVRNELPSLSDLIKKSPEVLCNAPNLCVCSKCLPRRITPIVTC